MRLRNRDKPTETAARPSDRHEFTGNHDGGQGSEFVEAADAPTDVDRDHASSWLKARHWSPGD